ncbi:hypothetical protein PMZ80_011129 [Knufia obscura]|uniref:Glycolipid transfer protein domain-containing protein n=1 Tax=Knufia obscura TaxID=1635080 RepID=A0ABR0R8Z1_9EURO|nr:hypothetical protein PMZ80_011129 [Knufia obscura]
MLSNTTIWSRTLQLVVGILLICNIAAAFDYSHVKHPRQFLKRVPRIEINIPGGNTPNRGGGGRDGGGRDGGRGGGDRDYAGGRGGMRGYDGPWHQGSFFGRQSKKFDDVPIDGDNGIHTSEFLDAAQALPSLIDVLDTATFLPASQDSLNNIQKIRKRYQAAQGSSGTLQKLVQSEKDAKVSYSGSASEALLWLTRGLDFTAQSLRNDLKDNKDIPADSSSPKKPLSDAFKKTYPGTLKRFQSGTQQAAFGAAWSLVPDRRDFYRKIGQSDSSQAGLEDTEKWVTALENIVGILNGFIEKPESRW